MEDIDETTRAVALEQLGRRLAHDMNNLLTIIKGNGEIVLEDLPPADPNRPSLEAVVGAVDRATLLMRQFHAFLLEGADVSRHVRSGRETILVVDDDNAMCKLAKRVLSNLGHVVLVANRGEDAIRVAAAADVDLLVADLLMTGMNGREVAEELCRRHPKLKVLFMSGSERESLMEQGLLLDTAQFLPKPFMPLELARRVRGLLDGNPAG